MEQRLHRRLNAGVMILASVIVLGAVRYLGSHVLYREAMHAQGMLSGSGTFFESYGEWNKYFFLLHAACWFVGLALLLGATNRGRARVFFSIGMATIVLLAAARVMEHIDLASLTPGEPYVATFPSWSRHIRLWLYTVPMVAMLCGLHAAGKPASSTIKRTAFYVAIAIAQLVSLWEDLVWLYSRPNLDDTKAIEQLQIIGVLGSLTLAVLLIWFLLHKLRVQAASSGFGSYDPVLSAPKEWQGKAIAGLGMALSLQVVLAGCSLLLGWAAVSLRSLEIAKLVFIVMPLGKVCTTFWIAACLYGVRMRLPTSARPLAILGLLLSIVSLIGDVYVLKGAWYQADPAPMMVSIIYSAVSQLGLLCVLLALAFELARAFPQRAQMGSVRLAIVFGAAYGLTAMWQYVVAQPGQLESSGPMSAGWGLLQAGLGLAAILSVARAFKGIHSDVLGALRELPDTPQAVATIRPS